LIPRLKFNAFADFNKTEKKDDPFNIHQDKDRMRRDTDKLKQDVNPGFKDANKDTTTNWNKDQTDKKECSSQNKGNTDWSNKNINEKECSSQNKGNTDWSNKNLNEKDQSSQKEQWNQNKENVDGNSKNFNEKECSSQNKGSDWSNKNLNEKDLSGQKVQWNQNKGNADLNNKNLNQKDLSGQNTGTDWSNKNNIDWNKSTSETKSQDWDKNQGQSNINKGSQKQDFDLSSKTNENAVNDKMMGKQGFDNMSTGTKQDNWNNESNDKNLNKGNQGWKDADKKEEGVWKQGKQENKTETFGSEEKPDDYDNTIRKENNLGKKDTDRNDRKF